MTSVECEKVEGESRGRRGYLLPPFQYSNTFSQTIVAMSLPTARRGMTRGVGEKRANEEQTSRGGEERREMQLPLPFQPAAPSPTGQLQLGKQKTRQLSVRKRGKS